MLKQMYKEGLGLLRYLLREGEIDTEGAFWYADRLAEEMIQGTLGEYDDKWSKILLVGRMREHLLQVVLGVHVSYYENRMLIKMLRNRNMPLDIDDIPF